MNIYEMAREGLKLELPSAIRRSISGKTKITYEGLRVIANGEVCTVNLTVKPVGDSEAEQGLVLVAFEEQAVLHKKKPLEKKPKPEKEPNQRIAALERELRYVNETHQITVEELETANEELKSTNEELQSTNEELQSANEELETSKEELQSLNEELLTVNTELEGKNDELSETNNDIKNLMDSISVPTIFVDDELRIKRFTSYAPKVIKLIPTDVGRPISDIVSNLEYENLIRDVEQVLETLAIKEADVQTKDGHWYLVRIMPYRTVDNVIDGAVITFLDTNNQKRAELAYQEACEFAEGVVDTIREPLVVLDNELRLMSANASFYKTFGLRSKGTEGHFIYDLGNRQWDIPRLRELLEEIIPQKRTFENFEVEHEFDEVGRRKMLLNAREIRHLGAGTSKILLAIQDVTDTNPA